MFRSFRYYFSFVYTFLDLIFFIINVNHYGGGCRHHLYTPASLRIDTGFIKYHRSHRRICPQQSDIRNSTGNTNEKKPTIKNAGTDHMNQNSKTNCESQAGSTNYEGAEHGYKLQQSRNKTTITEGTKLQRTRVQTIITRDQITTIKVPVRTIQDRVLRH